MQSLRHCAECLVLVGQHRTKLKAWRAWQDFQQLFQHRSFQMSRALHHLTHR